MAPGIRGNQDVQLDVLQQIRLELSGAAAQNYGGNLYLNDVKGFQGWTNKPYNPPPYSVAEGVIDYDYTYIWPLDNGRTLS
jgi:hypothetical protein